MTLLTFSSVAMAYGADRLFADMSFNVAQGEHCGILGRNGTGKTTLLRLIMGTLEPTAGTITRRSGLRTTLLDQLRDFGDARNVWEAAARGYKDLLALEGSLARESERLGELGDQVTEADLARFDRAQERFQHQGGHTFHARVDAVLQGLGLDPHEARERPLSRLRGGERGRVGLAAQVAAPAELVLLDEPTNHLDLETIDWLRGYLADTERTVMVISHDRALLRELSTRVWAFREGRIQDYFGPFVDWEQKVAEEEAERTAAALQAERENQDAEKTRIRRDAARLTTALKEAQGRLDKAMGEVMEALGALEGTEG